MALVASDVQAKLGYGEFQLLSFTAIGIPVWLLVGSLYLLLAGSNLRDLRFRQRFNATVLAVKRANTTLQDRLGRLTLMEGDLLLVQAPLDAIRGLQESSELVVLDELESDLPTTHRKGLAQLAADALLVRLEGWPVYGALVVVFAASQSFLSPIGYQTNLMVYSPGNYRFLDFLRFGWPLSLLYAVVIPLVILHSI